MFRIMYVAILVFMTLVFSSECIVNCRDIENLKNLMFPLGSIRLYFKYLTIVFNRIPLDSNALRSI